MEEALQILKRKSVDLVLLDFDLGQRDGREFVRLAKEQGFRGKILVVTAGIEGSAAAELIRADISGVFLKHESAALLARGIRDVMAGKVWFDHEQLQAALASGPASSQPDRIGRFAKRFYVGVRALGSNPGGPARRTSNTRSLPVRNSGPHAGG